MTFGSAKARRIGFKYFNTDQSGDFSTTRFEFLYRGLSVAQLIRLKRLSRPKPKSSATDASFDPPQFCVKISTFTRVRLSASVIGLTPLIYLVHAKEFTRVLEGPSAAGCPPFDNH
uniref:Uncharacterized protein n=1 Tax=Bactrocera latifrons TaxID=174628 RepID=A0A0K8U2R8_BACLA